MKIKYKALLLAAGFGTRLKPLTNEKPKCLMEIGDKPLLEHWLEKLEQSYCEEVLINTHYLSEQVEDFLRKRSNKKLKIITTYESSLLGTAGTLKQNINFFKKNDLGILIHADNYTKLNLIDLINAHKKRNEKTILTMATFKTDNPSSCGIVKTDSKNILIDFFEKPKNPKSFLANGALYAFGYEFLEQFSKLDKPIDFSKDVVKKFRGKIQTYFTNQLLIDIGTIESLKKARDAEKRQL